MIEKNLEPFYMFISKGMAKQIVIIFTLCNS